MKLRVALVQFRAADVSPAVNQARAEALVREAATLGGAQFVLLPELYRHLLPREQLLAAGEEIPGPVSARWASVASETGVAVLAGSYAERCDETKVYNTATLYDGPRGLVGKYRKRHLFDVDTPKVRFQESETVAPGDGAPLVADLRAGVRVGVGICYDLRFPELFRRMHPVGAPPIDLLCLPAAFSMGTGPSHWHVLLRARAIENQCFVLGPNQVGVGPNGFHSYGHSLVVSPWGDVLAEAPETEERIVYCDLDLGLLARVREQLPSLANRTYPQ